MTHDQGEIGLDMPTTTTVDSRTRAPVALLPIGSFEQHGPYLPLVTDTLIATAIADSISSQHSVFQLPVLAFGCSHEHADFSGTVSIAATTPVWRRFFCHISSQSGAGSAGGAKR